MWYNSLQGKTMIELDPSIAGIDFDKCGTNASINWEKLNSSARYYRKVLHHSRVDHSNKHFALLVGFQNSWLENEFLPDCTLECLKKTTKWAFQNSNLITQWIIINDSNPLYKYSFSTAWLDENENPLELNEDPKNWPIITTKDIVEKKYIPLRSDLSQDMYVRQLEKIGLPGLQLTPVFSVKDTPQTGIDSILSSCIFFQSFLKKNPPLTESKNLREDSDEWGAFKNLREENINEQLKKMIAEEAKKVYILGQPKLSVMETALSLSQIMNPKIIHIIEEYTCDLPIDWISSRTLKIQNELKKSGVRFDKSEKKKKI